MSSRRRQSSTKRAVPSVPGCTRILCDLPAHEILMKAEDVAGALSGHAAGICAEDAAAANAPPLLLSTLLFELLVGGSLLIAAGDDDGIGRELRQSGYVSLQKRQCFSSLDMRQARGNGTCSPGVAMTGCGTFTCA